MKVVVCLKQVPVIDKPVAIAGTEVVTSDFAFHLNDFDDYALEQALLIKGKVGAEVIVITYGPQRSREVLFTAMAKGADRAVHVLDNDSDRRKMGDIVEVVAREIKKFEPSLVLTGIQSEDLGSGQVGILLAKKLGLTHVTAAVKISLDSQGEAVTVVKELGSGSEAVVQASLPCVLTVQTNTSVPRYATVLNLMKARGRPVDTVRGLEIAPSDEREFSIKELALAKQTKQVQLFGGGPEVATRDLVERLAARGLL